MVLHLADLQQQYGLHSTWADIGRKGKGKGKGKGNKVSLFTCAASACLWRSSCAATSALL